MECLVCFDNFPVSRMIFCSVPLAPQNSFFAEKSALDLLLYEDIEDTDQPGPSSAIYEEEKRREKIDKLIEQNLAAFESGKNSLQVINVSGGGFLVRNG